jgi:hypothetical protein
MKPPVLIGFFEIEWLPTLLGRVEHVSCNVDKVTKL